MDYIPNPKVKHPDFRWASPGGHGGTVFVFERNRFLPVPSELGAEWDKWEKIVEKSNGWLRMGRSRYELGGVAPVFTKDDIESQKAAILKAWPGARITGNWNGVGSLSSSISVDPRSLTGVKTKAVKL